MKSSYLQKLNSRSSFFWVSAIILFLTLCMILLSEAYGLNLVSTSFTKVLGKTLCLCIVALAMDLVWGYCGILSLGHFAFFGLGGYMIGMWLMFERTKNSPSLKRMSSKSFIFQKIVLKFDRPEAGPPIHPLPYLSKSTLKNENKDVKMKRTLKP